MSGKAKLTKSEKDKGTGKGVATSATSGWRGILARHAIELHESRLPGASVREPSSLSDADQSHLMEAMGSRADEARRIVESFAAGAALGVGEGAQEQADAKSRFEGQLAIILNGLVPLQAEPVHRRAKLPPQIIQSRLWQLLQMARESAELSYAREIELVELDRRILLMLSDSGPLVPAEISAGTGVDKAQVSRSVKRLLELRMVERGQIRAPVILTRKGQALSDRLNKLAELRNRELTFGIGDGEIDAFFGVTEKLLVRAIMLYENERAKGMVPEAFMEARFSRLMEEGAYKGPAALNRRRILAPLLTLSAYFSRSGSLTFKRLTRLSSFEAQVLNEIGMTPPIEWGQLVSQLDRDHSQAGRTVNSLVERGLVTRHGKPGRRHGRFSPTPEGLELYHVIQQAGQQRNDFLLDPLTPEERASFLATFETLQRNAAVQLERERAYEEIERD